MDHFYESIPGFFNFEDLYRWQVERAADGARFVEVGAFMGKSSAFMAVEIVNSGKSIVFQVVDCWDVIPSRALREHIGIGPEGVIGHFMANHQQGGTLPHIRPVRAYSLEAVRLHEDASLDFVFLDDDHTRKAVASGVRAWKRKVKTGGILAGHNIALPDVHRGVCDVLGDAWKHTSRDCWFHRG